MEKTQYCYRITRYAEALFPDMPIDFETVLENLWNWLWAWPMDCYTPVIPLAAPVNKETPFKECWDGARCIAMDPVPWFENLVPIRYPSHFIGPLPPKRNIQENDYQ